ncbi:Biphenyl-2,3-diol 1,2-dioxygenase III [Brucella ceti TE28753-12]|uniref:Glyoxalase/fosfomycin resistance/dioxygenase domain-containing protein n=1 Tax=Brucella ceti M644/93/1 TaxID=520459 RepID=A0ABM9ZAC3_9HYPH|nr:Biphenyl-2,3-diol 1,2-dioxygenase III [Brucella ceti TE10759-12]AHB03054.1 Biphenyl-2,3-diol 1,2-dioxygenase III [Brucella ceti TE28753-12]EEX89245.1 conserved hypothetical protein [Brucella ceti M13/05/1]EEX96651.1 conserved hypothetical protein [Brucella ceti M644/93/1]ENR07210.1 hypothetical protein C068_02978 [Brucella sp. UK38/05]ENT08774.1 hypothetical protein C001_02228 [Brucella sp. F5/06]
MQISRIDHFVLTVQDIDVTCDFYSRACGMEVVTFAGGRKALSFGQHKINLHQAGSEFLPKAASPTRGSGDFCLISSIPLDARLSRIWKLKILRLKTGLWRAQVRWGQSAPSIFVIPTETSWKFQNISTCSCRTGWQTGYFPCAVIIFHSLPANLCISATIGLADYAKHSQIKRGGD